MAVQLQDGGTVQWDNAEAEPTDTRESPHSQRHAESQRRHAVQGGGAVCFKDTEQRPVLRCRNPREHTLRAVHNPEAVQSLVIGKDVAGCKSVVGRAAHAGKPCA